jgi:sigma54-dependent transcription regulator
MDGNFSAEHMRCRTGETDVPLSAGMAFMANPDSFKAHLHSGKEIVQVCWILLTGAVNLNPHRLAHVTHTGPLNRPIQVAHILMLQASEQLPAAMDSLYLHLSLTFRREKGMSDASSTLGTEIIYVRCQANQYGL